MKLCPSGHHYGRPTAINGQEKQFPDHIFTVKALLSPDDAATGQYFLVKNPFLTWHDGQIEKFKMEWLLD